MELAYEILFILLLLCILAFIIYILLWNKKNKKPSMWELMKSKPKNGKRNK